MYPQYSMNRKELEELIALAKAKGVPCPALEAKLLNHEYNEPWEEETIEIKIIPCDGSIGKGEVSEDQFSIKETMCLKELSN
jgi:hypothetical protein